MAETPSKRERSEIQTDDGAEEAKRHKSYKDILSLLDEEVEEPNQDFSSLLTVLQQELSSVTENELENLSTVTANLEGYSSSSSSSSSCDVVLKDEEEDKESVIRHLLEASDDELGIPNSEIRVEYREEEQLNDVGLSLCDGFWEFEDEAANYYTLLQSELFM